MNQSGNESSRKKHPLLKSFLASFAIGGFLTSSIPQQARAEMVDSPKVVVDEVWQIINNEFVDRNFNRIDWIKKREELLEKNYSSKKQAYRAINQALKELGDPYTRFLPPEQFETLTSQTSGEVSGVGIRIAIDPRTQDLYIIETIRQSPAEESGLQRGDRIVRIDGKPTALMDLDQASEALKGELGTDVNLEIARRGKPAFNVSVTRAQFEVPSVDFAMKREGELNIGYIKLEEFSSHAAEQMQKAIRELNQQKAQGFVLDLRGNPGGLLFASVDIARMWMSQGEIVDIVDRQGGHQTFSADNSAITDLPLVVLVDGDSASASEILAGALKENSRATLVGTNTFGKGTVQSVHSLSDGSGLAVTISRYYPPSGTNINKKGIAPDIVQALTREEQYLLSQDPSLIATKADSQYSKAIAILRTVGKLNHNNNSYGSILK
ncbi:carboxyl-terminal processing protease CtpB [Cyanobacterium sp. Dongsha4]|uniref:carboxyl-terminal processing protease CtpB n=1 Tax=Cyanobacterium sp. DS4 TaxID=2878255 RepID=UPI002E81A4FE|nr:carboxyl-terminal processing protease CtpB [Cyanobacterium sp. Dongsha4]WVK98961.1 PDZ domain-containing protein [Cyanobacterium sp. Dongsha4]